MASLGLPFFLDKSPMEEYTSDSDLLNPPVSLAPIKPSDPLPSSPAPIVSQSTKEDPPQMSQTNISPPSSSSSASSSSASVSSLSKTEMLQKVLTNSELVHLIDEILLCIKPSKKGEQRRLGVLSFLRCVVRKTLGAQVYPHGAFALKTYFQEDEIDVSAFFSQGHESTWIQKLVNGLCLEAGEGAQIDSRDPLYRVKRVEIIFGKWGTIIKGNIGGVVVNIADNQLATLGASTLYEYIDQVVGRGHLFKKTLILVEAWARRVGIVSQKGLLSSECLRALVFYLFNAYYQDIATPLQGLFKLLEYLENFDWDSYALTVYGPIEVTSITGCPVPEAITAGLRSWPPGLQPLLSPSDLRKYMVQKPAGKNRQKTMTKSLSAPRSLCSLHPQMSSSSLSSLSSLSSHPSSKFSSPPMHTSLSSASLASLNEGLPLSSTKSTRKLKMGASSTSRLRPNAKVFSSSQITQSRTYPPPSPVGEMNDEDDPERDLRPLNFPKSSINVLDPVDPCKNLGITVSYKQELKVRRAFSDGARELRAALRDLDQADQGKVETDPILRFLFRQDVLSFFRNKQAMFTKIDTYDKRRRSGGGTPSTEHRVSTPSSSELRPPKIRSASEKLEQSERDSEWLGRTGFDEDFGTMKASLSTPNLTKLPFSSSLPKRGSYASMTEQCCAGCAEGGICEKRRDKSEPIPIRGAKLLKKSLSNELFPSSPTASFGSGILTTPSHSPPMSSPSFTPPLDTKERDNFDILDGNLEKMLHNLAQARQFQTPDISEEELVKLIKDILLEKGVVPVGRMGSLLHEVTNNHSLPAMVKEHYGGLKRLLERHPEEFLIGKDHPYNPQVRLRTPSGSSLSSSGSTTAPVTVVMGPMGGSEHSVSAPTRIPMHSQSSSSPSSPFHSLSGSPTRLETCSPSSSLYSYPVETSGLAYTRPSSVPFTSHAPSFFPFARSLSSDSMSSYFEEDNPSQTDGSSGTKSRPRSGDRKLLTHLLAMDCEMVGVGPLGMRSILARCTIVNYHGEIVYDKYVKPAENITDYRTEVSGIQPSHLTPEKTVEFKQVQREVAAIIKNRVLVGHSLVNDLQALVLSHPKQLQRDIAHCKLICPHRPIRLKSLVKRILATDIQVGNHDSIEDARATLKIYKTVETEWEKTYESTGSLSSSNYYRSRR